MRSIQVATVRRYVCNRKAVSGVRVIGVSAVMVVGKMSDDGTARFRCVKTSLGGDSSDTWSRPSMRVLKMSQVEAGSSGPRNMFSGAVSTWIGNICISSIFTSCSTMDTGSVGALVHDEGVMKSACLHSRLSLWQLLQTGFFSSQRLCRALQV
jgi:hypothetical protein